MPRKYVCRNTGRAEGRLVRAMRRTADGNQANNPTSKDHRSRPAQFSTPRGRNKSKACFSVCSLYRLRTYRNTVLCTGLDSIDSLQILATTPRDSAALNCAVPLEDLRPSSWDSDKFCIHRIAEANNSGSSPVNKIFDSRYPLVRPERAMRTGRSMPNNIYPLVRRSLFHPHV